MDFKIYSTKEDFFKFCIFKLILYKESKGVGYFDDLSNIYKISKEDRWSLKIEEQEKKDFLLDKSNIDFSKYDFLLENYKEINKEGIFIFKNYIKDYIEKYWNLLSEVFTFHILDNLEISLIPSPIKMEEVNKLSAFVIKTLSSKIFFSIYEDEKFKDTNRNLYYLKTLLHELGHVFINNHKEFQDILKTEYNNKYKNINSWNYRNIIEELIVSSLNFSLKDFGILYKDLGFVENEIEKEKSLFENKYRRMTYEFLEDLKNNKSKDKLKIELPKFISKLVEEKIFEVK